jgi:cyclic pyranopterin phosphate synthase
MKSPSVPRAPLSDLHLFNLIRRIHEEKGIASLRFTGGEPLLKKNLVHLVAACRELQIPDLALTTNGQKLKECAADLKQAGLSRVNVSLDSLQAATFADITRGGQLSATLDGIDAVLKLGMKPLKLNAVIMRGINDGELEKLLAFAISRGCHLRFLELMPIGVAVADFEKRFVSCLEMHQKLAASFHFEPLPYLSGATSRDSIVRDQSGGEGVCGFIAPGSHPFCMGCRRLRLTAEGLLYGCLAHPGSFDLAGFADSSSGRSCPVSMKKTLAAALHQKDRVHDLSKQQNMLRIGG